MPLWKNLKRFYCETSFTMLSPFNFRQKHKKGISRFVSKSKMVPTLSAGSEEKSPDSSKLQLALDVFFTSSAAAKSEIIFALALVRSSYSDRSCSVIKNTFKIMFPDSTIAADFSMSSSKICVINHFKMIFKD